VRGVDTNLLLRYVTRDDAQQARIVDELFAQAEAAGERLHITIVVLCELIWALRSRPFRHERRDVVRVVEGLLGTALFELQERDLVRKALADFRDGEGDFADYLIGWQNAAAGCLDTVTFDRALEPCARFSVLR
jgi:predicted nucleic-acid-binding protein